LALSRLIDNCRKYDNTNTEYLIGIILKTVQRTLQIIGPALLLAACSAAPVSSNMSDTPQKTEKAGATTSDDNMAPARDGNIAIMEEFEAAKKKNTIVAYDLFIARHPNHDLAVKAKSLRLKAQK